METHSTECVSMAVHPPISKIEKEKNDESKKEIRG